MINIGIYIKLLKYTSPSTWNYRICDSKLILY